MDRLLWMLMLITMDILSIVILILVGKFISYLIERVRNKFLRK